MNVLYVAVGSAVGGMCRYGVSSLCALVGGVPSWWGTLAVNVLGSFVVGWLSIWLEQRLGAETSGWSLLLVTGFCGGFTTFSTFTLHLFQGLSQGHYWSALLYLLLSVVLSFAALMAGITLASRG